MQFTFYRLVAVLALLHEMIDNMNENVQKMEAV
jgi:hypothetical protein